MKDTVAKKEPKLREDGENPSQRKKEEKKLGFGQGLPVFDVLLRKQIHKPSKQSELKNRLTMSDYVYNGSILDILGMHRRLLKRNDPNLAYRKVIYYY